jgi:hypothetical protein
MVKKSQEKNVLFDRMKKSKIWEDVYYDYCFSMYRLSLELNTMKFASMNSSQNCKIGLSDFKTLPTFQTQNVSWRGGIEDNYQIATHNFSLELSQETILFWVEVMIKVNHIIFFFFFLFFDNPWAKWNLC